MFHFSSFQGSSICHRKTYIKYFCPNISVIHYVLSLLDRVVCRAVGQVLGDGRLAAVGVVACALAPPYVASHLE